MFLVLLVSLVVQLPSLSVPLTPGNCGLSGGEAGDGDAEWGAGDVIEANPMAKGDGRRFPAVLATNPDFEMGFRLPAEAGAHLHQFADTNLIEHLEGIGGQD